MFQCFPFPLTRVFWRYVCHFCQDSKYVFAIEFSEFLYVGQNGRNAFLEPIFFGFVLRLLNSGRLTPQKAHNRSVYTFHPYHWPAVKLSVNSAVFGSGSALWKIPDLLTTAESATNIDPLYNYNCCYGPFQVFKKPSHFRLAWSRSCTSRLQQKISAKFHFTGARSAPGHSRLKTHLFHKSFPPQSASTHLDCLLGLQWTGLTLLNRFSFLVNFYYFFFILGHAVD